MSWRIRLSCLSTYLRNYFAVDLIRPVLVCQRGESLDACSFASRAARTTQVQLRSASAFPPFDSARWRSRSKLVTFYFILPFDRSDEVTRFGLPTFRSTEVSIDLDDRKYAIEISDARGGTRCPAHGLWRGGWDFGRVTSRI